MNNFLDSNLSVNRSNYWRMLVLGCLDAIITLPAILISLIRARKEIPLEFYQGRALVHTDRQHLLFPKSAWEPVGFWDIFNVKWYEWSAPLFALVFFLLFGTTPQARARYWRVFWLVAKPFRYKPPKMPDASDVMFGSTANPESRDTGAS